MAIIKAVNSRSSLRTAINYITQSEKTNERLISGFNCSAESVVDEMMITKEIWNKTDGRQYKHFIQSFSPEENINSEQAHRIASQLVQEQFNGYEVILATHCDRTHVHTHIIVNSVSFENGQKFQQSKSDLQNLKDYSDKLCMEQGLSICHKGKDIATYDIGKYKVIEKAAQQNYKSYVLDAAIAVSNASKIATCKSEFIELMHQQGYDTNWTDNRKYITFTDSDGHKIRNNNLEKTFKRAFGKEQLLNGFRYNNSQQTEEVRASGSRTASEPQQTEQSRTGEQPFERELNRVHSSIREIEERTKSLSPTGREEIRAREKAKRAKLSKLQRESQLDNRENEHRSEPVVEQQRPVIKKDKGIDIEFGR